MGPVGYLGVFIFFCTLSNISLPIFCLAFCLKNSFAKAEAFAPLPTFKRPPITVTGSRKAV